MKYFTETVKRVLEKQIKSLEEMAGEVTSVYCCANTFCAAYNDGRFFLIKIENWPDGDSDFDLRRSCDEGDVWVLEKVGLLTSDDMKEQSALVKDIRMKESLKWEIDQYQKLKAKFEANT